ncbi:MAG TPA: alpha/beta fold hydrolase [Thermoanaerobaculia bacterium]|nr:alpha/beta fold hydrolase [Thermoanaerobaculia bacterium]
MSEKIVSVVFAGPAGRLEGLWKDPTPPARGSAVFAHPHPRGGGTLHSKVVYRASRALAAAGFGTLRFNFRGVGASEGVFDEGRGETDDVRAALDEAVRRGGLPLVAGGFSFGSAAALRASAADPRVAAFVGVGLPVATESVFGVEVPKVPALFVVGEEDTYGPPERLRSFLGGRASMTVIPGADHFFAGHLEELETVIAEFLAKLPASLEAVVR